MSGLPPPGESNYPREVIEPLYGTADRLEALVAAYPLLNWISCLNFLYVLGYLGVRGQSRTDILLAIFLILFISAIINYLPARLIARGMAWPPVFGVAMAVLLAVQGTFCFGIFGVLGLLYAICAEIRRYGVQAEVGRLSAAWF